MASLAAAAIVTAIVGFILYYVLIGGKKDTVGVSAHEKSQDAKKAKNSKSASQPAKFTLTGPTAAATKFPPACAAPDHKCFHLEVGGHSVEVMAVACSPDGRVVCSVSRDGNLRCTAIEDIGSAMQQHSAYIKLLGFNGHGDFALTWTANSKRVVLSKDESIIFYKIDLFSDKKSIVEVKAISTSLRSIHRLQLLDVEKWMLIAAAGNSPSGDNVASLYNYAGAHISDLSASALPEHRSDSNKQKHIRVKENATFTQKRILLEASPDNRYLAVSGHAADARSPSLELKPTDIGIYEVMREKTGEPLGLNLVFILAGHATPVQSVAWSPSGHHLVTVCDGGSSSSSWRFFDIAVPKIDLPVLLYSQSIEAPPGVNSAHVALNQLGTELVFVHKRDIYYFATGSGVATDVIKGALGNDVHHVSSSFVLLPENQLLWCFFTVVTSSKKVAIWKFSGNYLKP